MLWLIGTFIHLLSLQAIPALADDAIQTKSADECVRDAVGLNRLAGQELHTHWIETTADDGKPLKIDMSTRDGVLYFVFDKTKEGIWAEGLVDVCREKEGLVAKIAGKDIKLGQEAPRIIRWSMSGGANFHLKIKDSSHLHVSTFGWSGDFIPNDPPKEIPAGSAPGSSPAPSGSPISHPTP